MPTDTQNEHSEDLTTDRKASPSSKTSTSGKTETKPIKQSKKVAAKKKTVRKKAVKTADGTDSAKKKKSPAKRKETQTKQASGSDAVAAVAGSEAEKAPSTAAPEQPEKPAKASPSPAAPPPPAATQPRPSGGTGLMGFWIKVGASAFVILAGIIGISSFFGDDEASTEPEAAQAAASAQHDNASVANPVAESATAGGAAYRPITGQPTNAVDPASTSRYGNAPGTYGGAGAINQPAVNNANTTGVTPGGAPAAGQAPNRRWGNNPAQTPRAGYFAGEQTQYRPELYRPLDTEPEPTAKTQSNAVSEIPSPSSVAAPSQYPQPGTYAYPPAPSYGGGYGYPQPGAYGYPPAPHYGGYGAYYPY